MVRRLVACLSILALQLQPAAAADRPVVVELFTSQGCSSCPPADALLSALADRPGVLALAFHVDYWNRLGWVDPFSGAWTTARQYAYAALWGTGQVYTPQAVIDGGRDAVGSDSAAMEEAIAAARSGPSVPVAITAAAAGAVRINVGAGAPADAVLWLVGFDDRHETPVRRGENTGRVLINRNVVRGLTRLDGWAGGTVAAARPEGDRAAALLQAADGRILGAARL